MAMGGAWWAKRVKILLIASAAPMASARQVCLGGACHGRGEVPAGRGGGGPGGERLSVQGDAAGGGRAPDLPAWGRKRPGGEERLPWQLGGRRVREVERLSEADNKREVGPRGEACQGSRAGGMPRGALGGW